MLRVLVSLAFVALAAAAPPTCNTTRVCIKENMNGCDPTQNTFFTFYACSEGTYCSGNTCLRLPRLGEPCSSSIGCWDPSWDINCDTSGSNSGICRHEDIYGPGATCKSGDSNFVNGGCNSGLTCDPNTRRCIGGLALGADCSNGNDELCPPHSFCDDNGGTDQCVARKASGAQCNNFNHYECDEELICTDRGQSSTQSTCQAPFQQVAGASCRFDLDCVEDTGCDGGSCQPVQDDGTNCSANEDVCPSFQDCVCDVDKSGNNFTDTLPATCKNDQKRSSGVNFNTGSSINGYLSMQRCAKNNDCHDLWASENIGLESGPDTCLGGCLESSFPTQYSKQGNKFNDCSGAGFLLPSIALLLALALALFLLA